MLRAIQNTLLVAVLTFSGLYHTSSSAVQGHKYVLSNDIQMSMTLVNLHGDDLHGYDSIFNKPLVQVFKADPTSVISTPLNNTKKANSVFALAMEWQDKAQYYYALVEDMFGGSEDPYEVNDCKSSRVARALGW
ncbi:hypothetical protein [Thalassotalea maritima]|uniref:hypothetical protein n=1 Tax=Thalassotalea maritima TaxID=3242416 RepID=UPI0035274322